MRIEEKTKENERRHLIEAKNIKLANHEKKRRKTKGKKWRRGGKRN